MIGLPRCELFLWISILLPQRNHNCHSLFHHHPLSSFLGLSSDVQSKSFSAVRFFCMSSGCCFCVLLYSFSHKLRIASIHKRRKDLSRCDAALGALCPHDYGLSALLVHSFKFPSGGRKALIFHTLSR